MKSIAIIFLFGMLFRSPVFSQSGWFLLNSGTSASLFSTYFTDSFTGYVVGINGIVRKTTNAGLNWFSQTSSTTYWIRSVFFTSTNTGYIACGNVNAPYDGKIFKTTNGGDNWNQLALSANDYFYSIDFVDANTGYVSGYQIILKTTDAGSTWESQTFPSGLDWFFSIDFVDVNTGYSSGGLDNETEIYIVKTTDGGANWQTVYSNQGGYLFGISFIDANTGLSVGGDYSSNNIYILKTTNGGVNWDEVFAGNQASYLYSVCYASPDTVYVTGGIEGSNGVILKTTNGGVNWGFQTPNVGTQLADVYFTSANTGYIAGAYGRILKTTDGGGPFIGVKTLGNEVPIRFRLFQNYPNPFNPVTKIKFDVSHAVIGKRVPVKLIIYDLLGREVNILVNEELTPSTYEVEWNASNYSSGVYYYRIVAGSYTETKKMALIK